MRALSQYYLYNPDYCLLYIIFDFPFALLHKKDMPLFFARNFGGICSLAGFAILLLYCLTVCVCACLYMCMNLRIHYYTGGLEDVFLPARNL